MAQAGDVIENPFSGERIRFDETSAETGGEYLAGEIVLALHGIGPPEHVHPVIEERFRVLSGTLTSIVRGEKGGIAAGEELIVPPRIPHRWFNETGDEVRIAFEIRPALPLDRFLESVFALVQAGKTNRKGLPRALPLAPILARHRDVVCPPLPVQRMLLGVLARVAKLLGYPDEYRYPYDEVLEGADEGFRTRE